MEIEDVLDLVTILINLFIVILILIFLGGLI